MRSSFVLTTLVAAAPFACGDEGGSPAGPGAGASGETSSAGDGNPSAGGDAGRAGGSGGRGGAPADDHAGAGGEGAVDAGGGSGEGGAVAGEVSFLPLYESGTRLRAISVGEASSDTRRLVAFFDPEFDAECRFRLAEDGEYRCLPLTKVLTSGFADEACSEPVLYDPLATPCSARQPFLVSPVDDSTCAGARVVALEPRPLDTVFDGSCTNRLELEGGASVYEEGDTLPAASFVRAERVRNLNAGGFGVDELRGEDGSRQVIGMAEAEFGACGAREVVAGGLRCVPNRAYLDSEWFFADSACEETPLAYAVRNDGCPGADPVRIALEIEPGSGELPEILAVAPAVTGAVYELSRGACTEHDASDVLWTLHPLAGPFEVERLLALEPSPAGSGRARLPHYAHRGTLLTLESGLLGTPLFHDSELVAPCNAIRTSAGDLVCVPEGVVNLTGSGLSYSDAECAEPVLVAPVWTGAYFAPTTNDACGREDSQPLLAGGFYAVGAEASGETYVLDAEGDCQASGSGPYFRLTPAEPDFVPMVEVVE